MVRFGLYVIPQHPVTDSPVRRFREAMHQVRLARDAGFDAIATGQHFLSPPYQSLQAVPFLARLAAETGTMRLVTGVLLLSMLNPVEVAESVATLDIISEGRVIFGVGLGYRDIEYEAFGVERRHRVGRFLEALDLVKRLWTQPQVTFESQHFRVREAVCTIRPLQKPYPPIWIAANNDSAILRAARLGHPWFINPHAALPTIERQMALYRQEVQRAGHTPPADIPLGRELFIAPTREEAWRLARPYLEGKYRAYAEWGQDRALPGQESFQVPFEELARERFILGTPEDAIAEIERYHQRLGANFFLFRVQWPGMENYHTLRVIELFGLHVIPYFRKKYGG
ncbi:MAG: LLM class flavin-dependent oxidoreductase [Dehalococcoidia bacterium]|nr:LLM class flavin-dependent oxidoreductase [Dehalococcoidia bacterium]MDW8120670.1 LLM class flavin-dependent oxidoreductase [Chloroflexota bacterium]